MFIINARSHDCSFQVLNKLLFGGCLFCLVTDQSQCLFVFKTDVDLDLYLIYLMNNESIHTYRHNLRCRNPDFAMFDSYINHKDLIFQDATVRLLPIDPDNQTYTSYLGEDFVRRMQRMKAIDCVTGRASAKHVSFITMLTVIVALVSAFYA